MSTTSMEDEESIVPLLYDENSEIYMETYDEEVNDIVPRLERLCIGDNEPIYLPSNDMDIPSSIHSVSSFINNFEEPPMSNSIENVDPVFETDTSAMISEDADTGEAVRSQVSLSGIDDISRVLPSNYMNTHGSLMNEVPSPMINFEKESISDSNENIHPVFEIDTSDMISADADTGMAVGSRIFQSGTDDISRVLRSNNMNIPGSSINAVDCSTNNFEEASISGSNENVPPVFKTGTSDMIREGADTEMGIGSHISGTDKTSEVFSTNSLFQDFISNASEDGEIHTHPVNTKEEKVLNTSRESEETTSTVEIIFRDNPLDLSLKSRPNSNHSNTAISENENELPSLVVVPVKTKHVDLKTGEVAENSNIVLRRASDINSQTKTMEQFAEAMACGIVFDLDSSKSSYAADISSDDHSNRSSGIILDSPSNNTDSGEMNTASIGSKQTRKIAIVPPASLTNEIGKRPLVTFQTSSSSEEDFKNSSSTLGDSHKPRRKSKSVKLKNEKKTNAVVKQNAELPPKPTNPNHSVVKKEDKRPSRCKRKNSDTMTETTEKFHKRSASERNTEIAEETHLETSPRSVSSGESARDVNPPNKNLITRSRKRAISDS